MPEFILDRGTPEAARQFQDLDSFTQGYIEAMFFTSTGTGDDEELEHATFADLAPETLDKIVRDCQRFQQENRIPLERAYIGCEQRGYDAEAAGRDFWYTRNHHGTGYWDRQLGDSITHPLMLSAANYAQVDIYLGDDGKVYLQ